MTEKPDETRVQKALVLFRGGCNCAQSVASAFCAELGLDERGIQALAAGFGSGMGALQKTCGAVTGGIMVLGASVFREADPAESKIPLYGKIRQFVHRFERKHGSVECFRLLGEDITTPEGVAGARERNLFRLRCDPLVEDACRMLGELL
jgi:C_GCAxxG_C_C family probable redox protein